MERRHKVFLQLTYNSRFFPVQYEEADRDVQSFEEVESGEIGAIGLKCYELVVLDYSNTATNNTRGSDEKKRVEFTGMRIILDGLFQCNHEHFKVNKSSDSCWKFFPVKV